MKFLKYGIRIKHTPGPWEIFWIGSPAGLSARIHSKEMIDVCHISKEWMGNGDNAKLIAAAPDLLEALKLLYRRAQEAGIGNDFWPSDAFEAAEKAIARAEGRAS